MKITSISGSPHPDGNTATILNEIERPFKEKGHDVVRYCLGKCNINYCMGCKLCEKTGECAQNDDVQTIVNGMLNSDLVIIASPSYWGDVTGQMKVFIDRCTPYCYIDKPEGESATTTKGIAVAVRAGMNKAENENLVKTIEHFLGHLNIPLISNFTVEGINTSDDLKANPDILSEAYKFGSNIHFTLAIS